MDKRASFDTAAERYDRTRPTYPDEVIDSIIEQTGIEVNEPLLEIAPGTGQATIKFLERGFTVHGVELGPELARILREKCAGYPLTVDVSPFEAWTPETPCAVRMIYCATAFHWLDPQVRYQKCHDLLMPGGYLVLLWNFAPSIDHPAINAAYDCLWKYAGSKKDNHTKREDMLVRQKAEIAESGLFVLDGFEDYRWFLSQSRARYIEGFFAQSAFLSLADDLRGRVRAEAEECLSTLEDPFRTEFFTTYYVLKRLDTRRESIVLL